eukprot:NODE_6950_length_804_cov_299.616740_g6714_i0.p1 GENE.NODE_6950_length_804_cov_299.616740_g6714_i0~~NODE_6950_length_804_cov_299.616740_g6714_i0.p1  ORF type:complete len:233 (+),score=83.23 NODE_6950_length_804_cov_299.616740_g6714_i0:58-699(+)
MSPLQFVVAFCLVCGSTALAYFNPQNPQVANYVASGHAVGKVDPRMKFGPTFNQELQPWGDRVLLSLKQADAQTEWAQNRAIVVRPGTGVTDKAITEGATVVITDACQAKWTTATFSTAYPLHGVQSLAMDGKYVNGVSLNNNNPATLNNMFQGQIMEDRNSNQQHNYLLCPSSAIVGIVNTETWGNNRADAASTQLATPTGHTQQFPQFWMQ